MLNKTTIFNFKCFSSTEFVTDSAFNIFEGLRDSGKSSVLDAIFFSCRGKSAFNIPARHLVSNFTDSNGFSISTHFNSNDKFACIFQDRKTIFSNFDDQLNLASRVLMQPCVFFNRKSFDIIGASVASRRQLLLWFMFYFFPEFPPLWKNYTTALRSRSALLQSFTFDKKMFYALNELIVCYLRNFLDMFNCLSEVFSDLFKCYIQAFAPIFIDYELQLSPGFTPELFDFLLNTNFDFIISNSKKSFFNSGIHLCSFKILSDTIDCKYFLSQSNADFLSLLIVLVMSYLLSTKKFSPLILLDEPDVTMLAFIDSFIGSKFFSQNFSQFWISCLPTPDIQSLRNNKLFHVEHGAIF